MLALAERSCGRLCGRWGASERLRGLRRRGRGRSCATLAQHPKVVAIGEIGLDYYWEKVPHDQQVRALRAQLALAAELDLPVILHSRNARGDETGRCNAELLWEIEQWGPAARTQRGEDAILGIWHAFSGGLDDARAAYGAGFVLGLGGPVTFQNARRLHALAPQLRLDRLVLETDAPYLAPHPHRGQRNEPAYMPLIVQALANLLGTTPETVAAQTTVTADGVFDLVRRRGAGEQVPNTLRVTFYSIT